MKTEWSWNEIEAAYDEAGKSNKMRGKDALKAELTARKLRDDCPVMYDYPAFADGDGKYKGGIGQVAYQGRMLGTPTNVRPLITVDEAREIARRAVMSRGTWSAEQLDSILSGIDRDLDEYQYGPTDG